MNIQLLWGVFLSEFHYGGQIGAIEFHDDIFPLNSIELKQSCNGLLKVGLI